jgi:hypothetical protein
MKCAGKITWRSYQEGSWKNICKLWAWICTIQVSSPSVMTNGLYLFMVLI